MGTIVVGIVLAVLTLLAVVALAFQAYGLSGRVGKLEQACEVDRRHRKRLTLEVKQLQGWRST